MVRKITQYFVVALLMSTLLTGCYMALQDTDMAQQTMVIDLQSQEVLGYAGDGDYIRAKVYDADEATSMVDSSIITINDSGGGYGDLTYQPENLLPPLYVQSFFSWYKFCSIGCSYSCCIASSSVQDIGGVYQCVGGGNRV